LALLDASHPASQALNAALAERRGLQQALDEKLQRTAHWRDRLSPADTEAGLAQARAQQHSLLRFLQPSWWRLTGELKRRYDFAAHAVRPKPAQLLEELLAEHTARAALRKQAAQLEADYGCTDPEAYAQQMQVLRGLDDAGSLRVAFQAHLRSAPGASRDVERLVATGSRCDALDALWRDLVHDPASLPLATLEELARTLHDQADALPAVLAPLQEL
ncbi:DNA helicase, partial [Variovorax sp. CT11-76]